MADPYSQAAMIAAPFAQLGSQMFQGANMREAGYQKAALSQAQRGAFEGHANLYNAQAQKAQAEAQQVAQRAAFQSPEGISQLAANFAGLNEPQANEMRNYMRQGNWGVTPGAALPPEQEGPPMPDMPNKAPAWHTTEVQSKYNLGRLAGVANLSGTGNTDGVKLLESLLGEGRNLDAMRTKDFASLNGLTAANKGTLFDFQEFGTGDQSTGRVAFNQPYLAKNQSEVGKNNAASANSYASAGEHKAGAELKRSKIGKGETVTMPDGTVVSSGIPSGKEWKYDAGSDEFVAPPTPEFPNGRRSGNISKLNAAKSLDYVISQYGFDIEGNPVVEGKTKSILETTPQGGFMGLAGQVGKVTDSQKVKRFDNLKEQLSTELRTLFRIPGEGALSDKEQAQYGIQLPSVNNDKATNAAILNDIKARTKIRLDQGSNPLVPRSPQQPTGKPPALANVPDSAVAYLKANPSMANAFAAKYGKEATDIVLGKAK
jgi:hypothetical protein